MAVDVVPTDQYDFDINAVWPNGLSADNLKTAINADASLAPLFVYIATAGDTCSVWFTKPLDTAQRAALDAIAVANNPLQTALTFHVASTVVPGETPVLGVLKWEIVAGVVTNPAFFVPVIADAVSRCVGSVKTNGVGAELQLVEEGPPDVVIASAVLPDTRDTWALFSMMTNVVLRAGSRTYRLEARTNDALVTASLRFVSMSLLEVRVLPPIKG